MTSKRKHAERSRFSHRWNQMAARGLRGSWPYFMRRIKFIKPIHPDVEENEQTTEPTCEEDEA